jgi:hypothetical protein
MKKVMRHIDPQNKTLSTVNTAENEDKRAKQTRLAKRRNEVLFELLLQDPELKADSDALDKAVKQRFKERGLLTDREKAI